jgi:putative hydrolases of HD superfamily
MINDLLKFTKLVHRFQQVNRRVLIPKTERWENDLEHSYQLTLTAWYLIEKNNLKLDIDKVLKYAIIHDIVEAYAGDTYIYGDQKHVSSKKTREDLAAKRLEKEFPKFKSLHKLISAYEDKKDQESKFIYALDKLIPIMNIHLDNGRTWKKENVTLEMLIEHKSSKVALDKTVQLYFFEMVELLKKKPSNFN